MLEHIVFRGKSLPLAVGTSDRLASFTDRKSFVKNREYILLRIVNVRTYCFSGKVFASCGRYERPFSQFYRP